MQHKTEKFNQRELMSFKRQILLKYLFSICFAVGIGFVFCIFYNTSKSPDQKILYAVIIGIALFSFLYAQISTRKIKKDLSNGYKDLFVKKIDRKIAYEDDDPGIGSQGYTSPYWKYVFIADNIKYRVDKEIYNILEVNDYFIIPTAPNTGQRFKIRPMTE